MKQTSLDSESNSRVEGFARSLFGESISVIHQRSQARTRLFSSASFHDSRVRKKHTNEVKCVVLDHEIVFGHGLLNFAILKTESNIEFSCHSLHLIFNILLLGASFCGEDKWNNGNIRILIRRGENHVPFRKDLLEPIQAGLKMAFVPISLLQKEDQRRNWSWHWDWT